MRHAHPGFTVLEILIAVTIFAIGLAGASFAAISAYHTYRHQDDRLALNRLVHDQVEDLTATPHAELSAMIDRARRPEDVTPEGLSPQHDFVTVAGGEVRSEFLAEPPRGEQDDWRLVPRPPVRPGAPLQLRGGGGPDRVAVTLTLQHWDPMLDMATEHDRGLIRAALTVSGADGARSAVKYVSR